jgi:SIR2-like domain
MKIHDKDALITFARNADKPVAFLVGAPLSEDPGGGVPGVTPMMALVREEVRARDPLQLPRYEAALAGKSGGEAYQAALDWLLGNFGQTAVNHVVGAAVLKARKEGSPTLFDDDGVANDWYIPAGVRQLASLICANQSQFPGPILTTNFDPLLSLAIKAAGGRARLRIIQSDGGLAHDVKRAGEVDVVHLHGYWHDSDTLHTPTQLTADRPKLKASLQQILKQRALIVAAYGGWDDVFAHTLTEVAADDAAEVNVLWCFRETDGADVKRKYQRLLERVAPAITRGRFLCYGGIDCHSIFGEIAGTSLAPPAMSATPPSPLAGWELIDSAYLNKLKPLRPEEVIRYFDGATPTWRHAVSDAIPRRQAVATATDRLEKLQATNDACSLQLIRAAGGEGKSTLLLQAASDAVRAGGFTVLWRPSPRLGLDPEHIVNLDASKQWLIVADEAENLVDDLSESAALLHQKGRSNIHFLIAVRDADWRAKHGDSSPWDTWLEAWVNPDRAIVLRGIKPDDARAIVEAWTNFGESGLRNLNHLSEISERVDALVDKVKDAVHEQKEQMRRRKPIDGSFFGGLLDVRFGREGLQAHVRTFLEHLKDTPIESSKNNCTLFDALVYVAACHAVEIPGINENVLADLVSVPRDWVLSLVVRPLGEEAAVTAVESAGHVFTRHSKVAAAILVEADQALSKDVGEVWSAIVHQTVKTSNDIRIGITHPSIIHAGPRLQSRLPKLLPEQRRKEIAIAAAKASVKAESDRLSRLDSLAKTYRNANDLDNAVKVLRENFAHAKEKVDFAEVIRAYMSEWGVCEGKRGNERENALADAWLCGLSLSDFPERVPITHKDAKVACLGLATAFGKLVQPRLACPFAGTRRAATYLGRLIPNDPKGARAYDRYDSQADKINTLHPKDIAEAITWLTTGVVQARYELVDPLLLSLANSADVSFRCLESFMSKKKARS